jgi:hypothetical protein
MYDHTVDYPTDRHILRPISTLGAYKPASIDYHYELYNVDAYAGKALAFRAGLADRYAGLVCFNYQGSCARRTLAAAPTPRRCCGNWRTATRTTPSSSSTRRATARAPPSWWPPATPERHAVVATAHVLELAALVRECELVVSPDTAVIHIASVYNKKVLGFYVNSGNHRWFYDVRPLPRAAVADRQHQRHRQPEPRSAPSTS